MKKNQRNILVVGGAGFIGSHLVDKLVARGDNVVVVDNFSTGRKKNINSSAKVYKLDIRNRVKLRQVFLKHQFDYVIHQAAKINLNVTLEDPIRDVTGSVVGTINILNCCVEFGVKKIVYASSVAVYGRPKKLPATETTELIPIYSYGIVKKCAEDYIKYFSEYHGLKYTILRYANVYGPRQTIHGEVGVMAIFADLVTRDQSLVIYGDGSQTRDYVYIDDIADITLRMLRSGDGEVFNVGCGRGVTVNEIFDSFQQAAGVMLKRVSRPLRVGEIGHFYSDNSKLVKCLKLAPMVSIREGIKRTLDYCNSSKINNRNRKQ